MKMQASQSTPGFWEGVLVAVAISVLGGLLYSALIVILNIALGARLSVSAILSAYVMYLIWRSSKRSGRFTSALGWFAVQVVVWLFPMGFIAFFTAQITALWLIRSGLYCRSLLSALLDMGLLLLGVIAAVIAYFNTHSVVLACWSLFLVQALFTSIPSQWSRKASSIQQSSEDRFAIAHQTAEAALRKISQFN